MDFYIPLHGAKNFAELGGAVPPGKWTMLHTELFEYVYSTAVALMRFECDRCFVAVDDFSLLKLNQPTFRILPMAKKNDKADSKVGNWNGIASVPFNSPEKERFMKWQEAQTDWEIDLQELIAQDYKLSLSHDNRSGAIMASLSCYNAQSPNYKYTLISRAPTPLMAIAVTLFKHYVLCSENWNAEADAEADLWG